MTDNQVSTITPMLDRIFNEVRDIQNFYNSTQVTDRDKGRLRRLITILQGLDDDATLDTLMKQIDQAAGSDVELERLIDDELGPIEQKRRMRTFSDMPTCVSEYHGKKPRPAGTGQDDFGFNPLHNMHG